MPSKRSGSPVVLITGGSKGIGAACARAFQNAGWNVSTVSLAPGEVDAIHSCRVLTTHGDITEARIRELAVSKTLKVFGRIDVLINNAGVGLYAQPAEISRELFLRLLDVNVCAPLAMTQLVLPAMREQGSGTIVHIGSVAGSVALPWAAAYCASKAALHSIHDSLRRQLQGTPVHLMKVAPGIVDTNFRAHVLAGVAPASVRQIRRVVTADAVAAAILRGIRRRQKTVYIPRIGALFTFFGKVAPVLMDLYLSRLTDEEDSAQQLALASDPKAVQSGERVS